MLSELTYSETMPKTARIPAPAGPPPVRIDSRGDGLLTVGCAYMAAVSLTDAQDDDDQGERRRRRAPARR